ncbi:MAG: PAS domain S-box protein, partial [Sulfurimonas sp.]|nr:PAS domain S-box protein [Sulfurimonas sp.]
MSLEGKYKFLGIVFIFWSLLVSIFLYNYKEYSIRKVVDSQIKMDKIKYNSVYNYYKLLAKNINKHIIKSNVTMSILKQIPNATDLELNILRKELKIHLQKSYYDLKQVDFRQFHFHLKNNDSFLRMHKPLKFGDNLSDVRYGVKLVNKTLKPVDGFEEGKIINGFRFIFPIIDEEKNHLGSVEFSVKAKGFIKMMKDNYLSEIHFLVKKSIVDNKVNNDDLLNNYKVSVENPLYYVESSTDIHNNKYQHIIPDDKLQLEISKKMALEKAFALYSNKWLISFFPINNIENLNVAYFVEYTNNKDIYNIIFVYWVLNIVNIFILIMFLYILRRDYIYKTCIKKSNKVLSSKIKKEVEKNRKQGIDNYNVLFNKVPNAAWVIDPISVVIVDVNKAALDKYGYTKEEILSMSIYDFDLNNDKYIDILIDKFINQGINNIETTHVAKDGTKIDVIINTSKMFLNNRFYYLSIATDITHINKVQKEIQFHSDTLQAIVYILNELILNSNFNNGVENSLKKVVETLDVDRVYIFENHIVNNETVCSQKFEFTKDNISAEIDNPQLQNIPYTDAGIKRWKEKFLNKEHIEGLVRDFSGYEKDILELQNIKSILVMPIWFEGKFWGFIGFDDCTTQRVWHELEKDVLKALA